LFLHFAFRFSTFELHALLQLSLFDSQRSTSALIKLHDSLVLRLGPPSLDAEEEQDYQDIADFSEIPQRSAALCMDLQDYSGELRSMGQAVTNLH